MVYYLFISMEGHKNSTHQIVTEERKSRRSAEVVEEPQVEIGLDDRHWALTPSVYCIRATPILMSLRSPIKVWCDEIYDCLAILPHRHSTPDADEYK